MNTTEHLALIKTFCLRNLEIASKRTPGEWGANDSQTKVLDPDGGWIAICDEGFPANSDQYHANTQFIATCPGAAEAGWKATVAAIDWILSSHELADGDRFSQECVDGDVEQLANEILAAYPLTLIQP